MKKHTRPRDTRDNRDTRPKEADFQYPSKKWTRAELEREKENIDFSGLSAWPEEILQKAWLWELDRELGSGNWPFVLAWKVHQAERINERWQAHMDGKRQLTEEEQSELEAMWPRDGEPTPLKPPLPMLKCYRPHEILPLITPGDTSRDCVHSPSIH
jgi:hypothetical protein